MMKGLICKMLKGIFVTGWLCVAPDQVQATTYYAAPKATSTTPCTSSAAPCSFSGGVNKLSLAGGDTLNLLPGNYDDTDLNGTGATCGAPVCMEIANKSFASETFIQANNWSAIGALTEDQAIISPIKTSGVTWTHCTTCTSGTCNGIPAGVCSKVWYTSVVGYRALFARTPDGTPTYRVSNLADLALAQPTYKSGRCSPRQTWRACSTTADCQGSDTCTGSQQVFPSYKSSLSNGNILYVNWQGLTPTTFNGVTGTNPSSGLLVYNSSNITIRGLIVLNAVNWGMYGDLSTNLKFVDNHVYYINGNPGASGSDYSMTVYAKTGDGYTLQANDLAYSGSEAIHTQGRTSNAATNIQILDNYIHHTNDLTLLGPDAMGGTPQGMIITDDYLGRGNYSNSKIDGNFIDYSTVNRSGLTGIRLENNVNGIQVSNNIIKEATGACLFFDGQTLISNNNVFNNIFYRCGRNPTGGSEDYESAGISFGVGTHTNNVIFNNTVKMEGGISAIRTQTGTVTATGTLFKNNILVTPSGTKAIDWSPADTSNKFQNNLIFTPNNPIATINSNNYSSCITLNASNWGGSNACGDPNFVNTATFDYHTQSGSPAQNIGTATGMPAAHTASIVNTIASSHGLPSYDDGDPLTGSAWDAGATEYVTVAPTFLTDGSFELGDFNLGGAESTSPCTDVPAGTGGRATVFADPSAPDGAYAVKLEQYFLGTTCTPPALPGFKFNLTGLAPGNNYIINGWMKNPTAIDTLYPLYICMDDTCSDTLPLGQMGMPQVGLCVGGTHVGNGCGPDPGTETCPGGTCEPRAGYYPFSSIFQARSSSEFIRFLLISGNTSLYPRYIYLDNISISGSCVLTP